MLSAFGSRAESSTLLGLSWSGFAVYAAPNDAFLAGSTVDLGVAYGDNAIHPAFNPMDFEVFTGRRDEFSTNIIEIVSLGVKSEAADYYGGVVLNFDGWQWTPKSPGTYAVWARVTNYVNVISNPNGPPLTNFSFSEESSISEVFVHAQNDDFANAIEFPRAMRGTNFNFNFEGATPEPGEPLLFARHPARHSLWWKWKPTRVCSVRVRSSQGRHVWPVEIFTGSSLADLRRLVRDEGHTRFGEQKLLDVLLMPGRVYYIRVDDGQEAEASLQALKACSVYRRGGDFSPFSISRVGLPPSVLHRATAPCRKSECQTSPDCRDPQVM